MSFKILIWLVALIAPVILTQRFQLIAVFSIVVLVLINLVTILRNPVRFKVNFYIALCCMMFLLASVISVFFANDVELALRCVAQLAVGICFSLITILNIQTSKNKEDIIKTCIYAVISSGLVHSLIIIVDYIDSSLIQEYFSWLIGDKKEFIMETVGSTIIRPSGLAPHPNLIAAFLVFTISSSNYMVINGSSLKELFIGAVVVSIQIIAIFLTSSRGAIIGGIMALLITAVLNRLYTEKKFKLNKSKLLVVLSGLCVIVGVCAFVAYNDAYLMFDIFSSLQHEGYDDRLVRWDTAVYLLLKSPLFGIGMGNFGNNYAALQSQYNDNLSAHSLLMELLATSGIIGCSSFYVLVFLTLKMIYRKMFYIKEKSIQIKRIYIIVFSTIISSLTHQLVECYIHDMKLMIVFWLLMGIGYCANSIERREINGR